MRTRVAFLSVAVLLGACCGRTDPPALEATPQRIERTYEGCEPTRPDCARAVLSWPELRGGSEAGRLAAQTWIRERLLAAVSERAPADPETLVDDFISEYARFAHAFPESAVSYELERNIDLEPSPPGFISLSARERTYTGGAHGMEWLALATFDATTGRRVTLDALLRDDALPEFTAMLERRFRAARDIPEQEPLDAAGFAFESGRFAPTDNFAVTAEGLRFYWNPYEIASFANGPTDVVVRAEDVRPLLRDGGPYAD